MTAFNRRQKRCMTAIECILEDLHPKKDPKALSAALQHRFVSPSGILESSVYTLFVARAAGISSWDELETYTWHFSFSQKISDTTTRSIELIVDCTFSPDTGLTIAKVTPVGQ